MSPRARRVLVWSAGTLVAAAAGVFALGWWVTTTGTGARWGFERLGAFLPGKLDVRELSGPLRSPLEVRGLTYRTDRVELTADRVRLRWNLSMLLHRRLDIDELYAEDVRLLLGAAGDTPRERDSLEAPLPDMDLPLSIVVRDGLLNRLQITRPGDPRGTLIDRIRLDASTVDDSLHVRSLTLVSRTLDVELAGKTWPRGAYPLELSGRWAWRRPDGGVLQGTGTLRGSVDTLVVSQRISGLATGSVDGTLYRALGQRRSFDGDVAFERLDFSRIQPGWPTGEYTGRARLRGDVNRFTAVGNARTTLPPFGPTDGAFRLAHDGPQWRIERLSLRFPGKDAEMAVTGLITTGDERPPRFRLNAQWTRLDWPLQSTPWVRSERGGGLITGTADNMEVRITADLAGGNLPPGQWFLDARGGNGRMAVRTVVADMLNGRITGSGRFAWSPRVQWALAFEGRDIDPASVWPEWPGRLAFGGETHGMVLPSRTVTTVAMRRIDGTLRDQPVTGHGTLDVEGRQYALDDAQVQWGPNRAAASGGFGDVWSLAWSLDAPRLEAALPRAGGAVRAQGRIDGPRGRMRVSGEASGDSLNTGDTHVGSVHARGDVGLAPSEPTSLDVTATDLDFGTRRSLERVVLTGRGTSGHHEIRASLAGRRDSLVAVFEGGLDRGQWRGLVRAFDLARSASGRQWSLESPAALAATTRSVELRDFAWRSGQARLGLNADWQRQGPWSVDATVDSVPLPHFQPILPDELRLEGTLHGIFQVRTAEDGRLFAHVDLVPGSGAILHLTPRGEWVPTRFEGARLVADADGAGLRGEVSADFVGAGTLRGTLRLPGLRAGASASRTQPVDGRLALHLTDLAMLAALSPELDETRGALDAELTVGGTLATPALAGDAQLRGGQADVPRLGIQIRDATLTATSSAGGALALHGSLRSGDGRLDFNGSADIADRAKPRARLTARGQNLQAMNTRTANVVASPDLHLELDGNTARINGEVVVPRGEITLQRRDPNDVVVRPSPDVVYTGADTTDRGPIQTYTRVRVVVGDRVRVRGMGLDVQPRGSVLAIDEPGLPMVGTGELRIEDGTYDVYGQRLDIEHGWLIFGGGPIHNPALDVRAERRADDGVVAGFLVRGTVQRPEVRVFSEPAMGESQALAYVLLGRPLESANMAEGQLVSTMATTVGLSGTNFIAHGIASNLGIDDARIVTTGGDLENTSLLLGSQLSHRLYLGYGVGLFDPTPVLRLRYLLSKRWTIEAETSRENRLDLLYTIERR